MERTQDCPMCGELMRLKVREQIDLIPGQSQSVRTEIKEWVCPDCDYFEEYEEGKEEPSEQP